MDNVRLYPSGTSFSKQIRIESSKSLANRALIIRTLCDSVFEIHNLPKADDTAFLQQALENASDTIRVGSGGTTFRFLLAYFSFRVGTQQLITEGSLVSRPIQPLVDVLHRLGANIQRLSDTTWEVGEPDWNRYQGEQLDMDASVSSQFVSALLLVAPTLKKGIRLRLSETVVSSSYISMTISMMRYFGIEILQTDILEVLPQPYTAKPITIEPDWSSLSYLFGWVSICEGSELRIPDIEENSWQGDKACIHFFKELGVESRFENHSLILQNTKVTTPFMEFDLSENPDLFPVLAVVCAIHGIQVLYSGLDTLVYKESNRIQTIQQSLEKVGVYLSKLPERFSKKSAKTMYLQEGKAVVLPDTIFPTYEDHRIALSVALFANYQPIVIENANVVNKSFPDYWSVLQELGCVRYQE